MLCLPAKQPWLEGLTRILADGGHRAADGGVCVRQRVRGGVRRQEILELHRDRGPSK